MSSVFDETYSFTGQPIAAAYFGEDIEIRPVVGTAASATPWESVTATSVVRDVDLAQDGGEDRRPAIVVYVKISEWENPQTSKYQVRLEGDPDLEYLVTARRKVGDEWELTCE